MNKRAPVNLVNEQSEEGAIARWRHIQDQQFFILFYFKSYPTFDERAPAV